MPYAFTFQQSSCIHKANRIIRSKALFPYRVFQLANIYFDRVKNSLSNHCSREIAWLKRGIQSVRRGSGYCRNVSTLPLKIKSICGFDKGIFMMPICIRRQRCGITYGVNHRNTQMFPFFPYLFRDAIHRVRMDYIGLKLEANLSKSLHQFLIEVAFYFLRVFP